MHNASMSTQCCHMGRFSLYGLHQSYASMQASAQAVHLDADAGDTPPLPS
eukprot:m.531410 g.531410  ORF g.531410 m.531410 type:complete len:50 (-) comp22033_c0_seq2:2818-2967(-)